MTNNYNKSLAFGFYLFFLLVIIVSVKAEDGCSDNNGGCQQLCIQLLQGVEHKCDCKVGYRLQGNSSCEDVNECELNTTCSHTCINTVGSYHCQCFLGYSLDPNNSSCQLITKTPLHMLIVLSLGGISKLDLSTGKAERIIPSYLKIYHGMDYMYERNVVFWIDINRKTIMTASIIKNNSRITTIVSEDTETLRTLATDWVHNNLYWTDTGKHTIEVMCLVNKYRKTLMTNVLAPPHEIAVDPIEGWMFWSTRGFRHTIRRAGLDGSGEKILVVDDVQDIYYLVVDMESKRLIWTDPYNNKEFHSSDYNGQNILKFSSVPYNFKFTSSLDVFQNWVYSCKMFSNVIIKFNKETGREVEKINIDAHFARSSHVFHPDKQPKGVNYCHNPENNCSHLCLPNPMKETNTKYRCACPDGMTLSYNLQTCVQLDTTTPLPTTTSTTESLEELLRSGNFTCPPELPYLCKTNPPRCISDSWVCDDDQDCLDGSDEKDCALFRCSGDNKFLCDNGRCLSYRSWVCDQENDCGDNSDERNCNITTCSITKLTCDTGECYPINKKCDGTFDCPDRSDEKDCPPIECRSTQKECANGRQCVPKEYLCDGDKDCRDGSDELNCTKTCFHNDFKCKNENCVSKILLCDGEDDCGDNSDEITCSSYGPETKCNPDKQFDCGISDDCISLDLVCNDNNDCGNWQDESELCGINECARFNGGCSHICVDLKIGFKCYCNKGYQLQSNNYCKDTDECTIPGSCSQKCTNTAGSFVCECNAGYKLNGSHSCIAERGGHALVIADGRDIRKFEIEFETYNAVLSGLRYAVGLDYVYETKTVYWSDSRDHAIMQSPMEGTKSISVVANDNIGTADGIAVDWIHNNIYWTDRIKNTIEVMNLNNKARKILIKENLDQPRAIVLNPLEGWMFWTDWGTDAKIERAGLDGTHRESIVTSGIVWPNGLAIDLEDKRLFWADGKLNLIKSADYNGANIRTVVVSTHMLSHPFSLDVFEDWIYFTDWKHNSVLRLNKFNGKDRKFILTALATPMTLHVYHPYKKPIGKNYCDSSEGKCSHLCLPAPQLDKLSPQFSCDCPDNMTLLVDSYTCFAKDFLKFASNDPSERSTTSTTMTTITSTSTESPSSTQDISTSSISTIPETEAWIETASTTISFSSSTEASSSSSKEEFSSDTFKSNSSMAEEHLPAESSSSTVIAIVVVVIILVIILVIGVVVYRRYHKAPSSVEHSESLLYSKSEDQMIIRNRLFNVEEL